MEARYLFRIPVSAEQAAFPAAAQAARLTRRCLRRDKITDEDVVLLSSRPIDQMPPAQFLQLKRLYWSIENGFHLPLDVSTGEDRSRVRTRNAAFVLGMFRRATMSFAAVWKSQQTKTREKSTSSFFEDMTRNHHRKAFSLVTRRYPTWLPRN